MSRAKPTPNDQRRALACQLAAASAELAAVTVDAPLASFATSGELRAFREQIERASREINAAACTLHDLTFGLVI